MLEFFTSPKGLVVGCDEAGRGCLAGPVTAGAVILPEDYHSDILNDSKQLSEKKRNLLRTEIEREALEWSVVHVWPEEIDEINILNASFLAMHRAMDNLKAQFGEILVDGNRFNPYKDVSHQCVIKGDGKILQIAAASILAKTHRDELMETWHEKYPHFDWKKNKGYPTKHHRAEIAKHGATEFHRMSFQLLPKQLKMDI
jgi:ribonuclease HII